MVFSIGRKKCWNTILFPIDCPIPNLNIALFNSAAQFSFGATCVNGEGSTFPALAEKSRYRKVTHEAPSAHDRITHRLILTRPQFYGRVLASKVKALRAAGSTPTAFIASDVTGISREE